MGTTAFNRTTTDLQTTVVTETIISNFPAPSEKGGYTGQLGAQAPAPGVHIFAARTCNKVTDENRPQPSTPPTRTGPPSGIPGSFKNCL
eukprot:5385920-Amphidinium_carterae.1